MVSEFNFDSREHAEGEAFQAYADLYRNGSDVEETADPFKAIVVATRLEGLIIFDRRLSGVTHMRQERVETDGFDHIVLTAVISGHVTGSQASGFVRAEARQVFFVDTLKPSSMTYVDAHVITASIAKPLIIAALGSTACLHGRVVSGPAVDLMVAFLVGLATNAGGIDERHHAILARAFVDMLGCLDIAPQSQRQEVSRRDYLKRELVERFIGANLHRRGLSAAQIAEGTGLSRSALYRLYDARGGIAKRVQRERVIALRQALDDRDKAGWDVLAERFGFGEVRRMNTAFSSLVGQSPAAYRKLVAASAPDTITDSFRRWKSWMAELA